MISKIKILSVVAAILPALFFSAPECAGQDADGLCELVVRRLVEAGYANVRYAAGDDMVVFTIENDSYKLPTEGFSRACRIVEGAGLLQDKKVEIIGTHYQVPEITLSYSPEAGTWRATRRLDEGWDMVRGEENHNGSFGKVDIVIYPQVSLKNLIINQVYQSLWQLNPALEVSLWPGMKFSYQMTLPIYNDGYGSLASRVHPGMITLSQRFRDPWHLNVTGKLSAGVFSGNRYGAALEMMYYFPNERFSLDAQLGVLANCYWDGFKFHYSRDMYFRWNVAANYYCPPLGTQFTLRLQKFLLGDVGLKYEMIRHFRHCSTGLYAEKARSAQLNVGFRFQVALPPYNQKRRGYIPRVRTSGQMGMSYNANNEQYYYKEFRTEASDNIMSKNQFNPYFIESQLNFIQ